MNVDGIIHHKRKLLKRSERITLNDTNGLSAENFVQHFFKQLSLIP